MDGHFLHALRQSMARNLQLVLENRQGLQKMLHAPFCEQRAGIRHANAQQSNVANQTVRQLATHGFSKLRALSHDREQFLTVRDASRRRTRSRGTGAHRR